jgi:hypothetical protein
MIGPSPLSLFHRRSVLSKLPETMRVPSGLKATLVTAARPCIGSR